MSLGDLVAAGSLESFCFLGASLEAVDATFGIDDLFFAREEWMRCARNLNLYEWIFLAISPFDGFFGLRGGAS